MQEQDDDRRSEPLTVLAVESDPEQAATIRHVVCDLVRAKLTLVTSVAHAVQALHTQRPDLILLPMLVSPADETQLIAFLRALPNGAHIETQITPVLRLRDATAARHGLRRWRAHRTRIDSTSAADPHLFAERLSWSLERRREQQQADRCRVPPTAVDSLRHAMVTLAAPDPLTDRAEPPPLSVVEPRASLFGRVEAAADTLGLLPDQDTDTNPLPPVGDGLIDGLHADRRAHRRFSGHELPGLRSARIKFGPSVSIVDLSARGALVETEARLRPESEAVLELLGNLGLTVVPCRVVRWQVSALNGRLRYRGACAFTQRLDLAELELPGPGPVPQGAPLDWPEGPDSAGRTILESRPWPANTGTGMRSSLHSRQVTDGVRSDQPERRQHIRVDGPFDGCRHGAFDMPVLIHNLSESGCFIDARHPVEVGHQLTLGVHPPGVDWIAVKAEVVRGWFGFGFAVRFVEMSDAARAGLARLVASRAESVASQVAPEPIALCNAW